MRILKFIYTLILLSLLFVLPQMGAAQTVNQDSVRQARQHQIDSTRQAQQHYRDSVQAERIRVQDSIRTVQAARRDSLKAIQNYRKSNRYKDSVAAVRQHTRDSIIAVRKRTSDSLRQARQAYMDSVRAEQNRLADSAHRAQQHYQDSVRAYYDSVRAERERNMALVKEQMQKRKDSIAAVRAYRESKEYKDSVAAFREHRRDSLIAVRKHTQDSLRAIQTARNDSIKAVRTAYNDSLRAAMDSMKVVRQKTLDSMKAVRQVRADSIAQVRSARKEELEARKKEREKKKELALEMKVEKEHDAYSNKKMLRKKWSFTRKAFQNTYTRYNYVYNANLKMEAAEKNMLQINEDNYDSLLAIFPFDPKVDSARLSSDMDSILSIAGTGIQIHDPRAKWQDDLYLLVGQAYYYKGDFENASAAFRQVVSIDEDARKAADRKKKKKKSSRSSKKGEIQSFAAKKETGLKGVLQHMPAKNKAVLWLSRTLVETGATGQAQTMIDMMRNDANFPKEELGRLELEQAYININNHQLDKAADALSIVAKDKETKKWQRQRAGFIAGQIYRDHGDLEKSNAAFNDVVALHPKIEMDFYARKYLAFNELKSEGGGDADALNSLERLAKDGKYKPFYDQIYYGIALAQIKMGTDSLALQSLKTSVSYGNNNPKQSGLSYTAIGDLQYKKGNYIAAKNAYDSASGLLQAYPDLAETKRAELRGQALSQITEPALQVKDNDSLLALAALPEKDQRAVIKQRIKELEKAQRDSLFLAQNGATATNSPSFAPKSNQNWYFSNPSTVSKGKLKFAQDWGGRKLRDNWRLSGGSPNANDLDNLASADDEDNNGLPTEDDLYALIPHTQNAIDSVRQNLEFNLYLLGKGYYAYLEDFDNANQSFDTLLSRFPADTNKAEVFYLKYLMALKENKTAMADEWHQKLEQQFPNSKWFKLLSPEAEAEDAQSGVTKPKIPIDEYYNTSYNLLMSQEYDQVLERSDAFAQLYSSPGVYLDRFTLLRAASLIGKGNWQDAKSLLTGFENKKSGDGLHQWGKDLLTYIRFKYEAPKDSAQTANAVTEPLPAPEYSFDAKAPHYVLIIAPADARIFALRSGLRDFALLKFKEQNLSFLMTTLNSGNNIIICKTFEDLAKSKTFATELKKNQTLFRDYEKAQYKILEISETNYPLLLQQKSEAEYEGFYNKHIK